MLLVFSHLLNCHNLPLTVEGKSYWCMYDGPAVIFILQPSQVSRHSFKDVFSRLTLTCRQDLSDRLRLVCTDEKTILSSGSFINQFRMHGFLVVNPPRGWPHLSKSDGGMAAQLVERSTEKPGAILLVWQGIFHPSQLSVLTLLRCPYSPCVLSPASTSTCTLKIPNAGSHTIVWTHKNTALW